MALCTACDDQGAYIEIGEGIYHEDCANTILAAARAYQSVLDTYREAETK